MNKNLVLLLLLALLLPATAAAHDFEVDGIYYNINGNEATVTYRGTSYSQYSNEYSGSVTIPSTVTYNGMTYSVTSIGYDAFYGCSGLTSVDIPNSVIYIGQAAFCDCSGLTSINIPNSVTSIGESAFFGCTNLTSVNIPNSVTSIGGSAFYGTPWYNNQPDGLVYVGLVAYKYKGTMPSGTSISLRDGTLGIAGSAFSGCSGLTSITIPNSVTEIGSDAFYNTPWYDNQPDGLVYAGLVAYKYKGTMPEGTSITIREGTISITGFAFTGCGGLTSIDIPNSVTIIGDFAFAGCSGLTNATIGNSVTSIGNHAFADCSGLTSITIPSSVITIGDFAFEGCTGLTSIIIPNSVSSIGYAVFSFCSGLTSITIPNSVTSIGEGAFYECSGLTSITIPNSVTYIGVSAFLDCSGLTSIDIPNSVTTIGYSAFYGCSGLTSITIPNSVTSIGGYAFEGCSELTSIIVDNDNPNYDSRNNCNAIIETSSNTLITGCMNTTIPNSVTTIGSGAFSGCSGLTCISVPNSVTSIGNDAFRGCSGLTSIDIPNSVTSIGYGAFSGCSGLTEIYSWSLTLPTIYSSTFNGCYGATLYVPELAMENYQEADYWKDFTNIDAIRFKMDDIYYRVLDESSVSVMVNNDEESLYGGDMVIPDTVTYQDYTFAVTGIENNAFDGCYELTSVVIPNTVESIGEQAFQGCTGLKSVTIGSGVTVIGSKAFNYCNALETVKCIGTVPPVMASSDCFSTAAYNLAQLLVPRLFIENYQAADYWYKFASIEGWGSAGPGDVDGDGNVNIKDATDMIDVMLGGGSEDFYFESSDFNNNGRVDIADVVTLIDYLLNGYY